MEEVAKSDYGRYVLEARETEATEHRLEIVKKLLEKLPESEQYSDGALLSGRNDNQGDWHILGCVGRDNKDSTPSRPKTVARRRGTLGPRSSWRCADIIEYKAEHHAKSC